MQPPFPSLAKTRLITSHPHQHGSSRFSLTRPPTPSKAFAQPRRMLTLRRSIVLAARMSCARPDRSANIPRRLSIAHTSFHTLLEPGCTCSSGACTRGWRTLWGRSEAAQTRSCFRRRGRCRRGIARTLPSNPPAKKERTG
eukprot:360766-Chlamydomonas_euryale.AAC.19